MSAVPTGLRVEHLDTALGIRTRTPRLSWQLPDGARQQHGYRIVTDNGWDTGWIASAESVLVPYDGPALSSSERVEWRVRVRTDLGESDRSGPCFFETGLLWTQDWEVPWLEPGVMPDGTAGARPAALLRWEFELEQPVVRARLHATAQGIYEAFLNGGRVGDAELTPGFTQYDSRLQVQTFDVTEQLHQGRNALAVLLSDGWFRGQLEIMRTADQWGNRLAFLAQLQLELADGSTTVIGTGPSWRSTVGHVVAADLMAGQQVDYRLLPRGWELPGFDDASWDRATVVDHGYAGLVDSPSPPVRRVEEIIPVSVRRLDADRQIVDLGQNINGWIRLTNLGPAGTTTTLTHGEWLDSAGDVTVSNLKPDLPFLPFPLPAGQVDSVTSAGVPGDVFEPRHTTHGFQYVRVEGHPDDLTIQEVQGVMVHTDMRRTGWFTCSDDRINALHEAAVRSFRGNACDIPTDCPHRERAGWTGDWQLYFPTAAFLFDVAGFSTKWLRDVAADQWPDGTIANISPTPKAEGRDSPVSFLNGSAGWGDAAIIVPWQMYQVYGDKQILAELWPTMVGWMDRTERTARNERHPARAAERPDPLPHEEYLWDAGFHWGEWLVPGDSTADDLDTFKNADKGDVATAFYAHSTRLMSRIADVLGKAEDAARYAELSDRVRRAWQLEYVQPDGGLYPDTQANHVRALAFDLIPTELRAHAAARLVELIHLSGNHLGTGFLATPSLLPMLAETGYPEVGYRLLLQNTEPSWMTMIERGSTTMWELWNGVDDAGVPHDSLNHYSKGAVISFLHQYSAGIALVDDHPAYRRFRIRPRPGGGLTWVEAAHESPYGRIDVRWTRSDDVFSLKVLVPAGTEAEVVLPDDETATIGPGEHHFHCTLHADDQELVNQ